MRATETAVNLQLADQPLKGVVEMRGRSVRRAIRNSFVVAATLLRCASPAAAQTDADEDRRRVQLTQDERNIVSEEEIVVRGIRLLEEEDAPTKAETGIIGQSTSRGQFMRAEMFARCADRPRLGLLRRTIDGEPNSADARYALDMLIRTNIGCYPDVPRPTVSPPELGTCHAEMTGTPVRSNSEAGIEGGWANPTIVCRALYTRSALIEKVIRTYAADFDLTRELTRDPTVAARFMERERPRNRLRLERDRIFFAVTSCLVQADPNLARLLLDSPPAGSIANRIQVTMYAVGPHCIGHVNKVRADPAQFRTYIADAYYRWLIAAMDVASLLPASISADTE